MQQYGICNNMVPKLLAQRKKKVSAYSHLLGTVAFEWTLPKCTHRKTEAGIAVARQLAVAGLLTVADLLTVAGCSWDTECS